MRKTRTSEQRQTQKKGSPEGGEREREEGEGRTRQRRDLKGKGRRAGEGAQLTNRGGKGNPDKDRRENGAERLQEIRLGIGV